MDRIIIFLGAGVSKPSGLPLGDGLTKQLWAPFRRSETGHFVPSPVDGKDEAVEVIQEFLSRLSQHHQEFRQWQVELSREGMSPGKRLEPTYEDLHSLASRLRGTITGHERNALAYSFSRWALEHTEDLAQQLVDEGTEPLNDEPLVATLSRQAVLYINCVVRSALTGTPDHASFQLVIDLVPSFDQVTIATLNHDTLVEQVLDAEGIRYVDGFGEEEEGICWYDPEQFVSNREATVRLLKLHGSINWWWEEKGGRYFKYDQEQGAPEIETQRGRQVRSATLTPSFLTGIDKESMYTNDLYADMQRELYLDMRGTRRVVMSGYGMGDQGINPLLLNWLQRQSENSIIRLHGERPEPRLFFQDGWNDMEILDTWLCDASLAEVETKLES